MKVQHPAYLAASCVFLTLAGCGGGGGSSANITASGNSVALANTVRSVTPTDNAATVDTSTPLVAVFSQAIDPHTSFTLASPNGTIPTALNTAGDTATLTPTRPLALLTRYTTTITNSVATALSGNYSWSFTTRDGEWQTAVQIDNNTGNVNQPRITADNNGNAIAIWTQQNGMHYDLWSRRYTTATRAWDTATLLSDGMRYVGNYRISVNGNGDAVVIWQQQNGAHWDLNARQYSAVSNTWNTTALLSDGINTADVVQIDIDAGNNVMALWTQQNGMHYDLWARSYIAATRNWETAALLSDNIHNITHPQVVVDAAGNATTLWTQQNGTRYEIWTRRRVATARNWEAAVLLCDWTNDTRPQVAVDTNGNIIAAWQQWNIARWYVYARRFNTVTNTWDTATPLSSAGLPPQIVFDAGNNAMALWSQQIGTRHDIVTKRYDAASNAWSTTMLLSDGVSDASNPQVSFDAGGNALAVWMRQNGAHYDVLASRYAAGAYGWGPATVLSGQSKITVPPVIAVDAGGNAVAVWSQQNGAIWNLWANRYTTAPIGWGTATLVSDPGIDIGDNNARLSMDAGGVVTVTWPQSNGTMSNLWARRFE